MSRRAQNDGYPLGSAFTGGPVALAGETAIAAVVERHGAAVESRDDPLASHRA